MSANPPEPKVKAFPFAHNQVSYVTSPTRTSPHVIDPQPIPLLTETHQPRA